MNKNRIINLILTAFILILFLPDFHLTQKKQTTTPLLQIEIEKKMTAAQKSNKLTILGLGDSLTRGIGDVSGKGYITRTKELLNEKGHETTIINLATSGATTADLLVLLKEEDILRTIENAHIIFITIGGNDLFQRGKKIVDEKELNFQPLQLSDTKNNSEAILKQITEINERALVYWLDLYNPFELTPDLAVISSKYILHWNYTLQNIASNFANVRVVPIYDLFTKSNGEFLYRDNFHLNNKGYQLVAERLFANFPDDLIK